MALKIDQGFLGALGELFTPSTDPEAERQKVTYERNWFLLEWGFYGNSAAIFSIVQFRWVNIAFDNSE